MKIKNFLKATIHESLLIGILLAIVGGFLDIYTYLLKGNVFANAQTGNIVLMGLKIAQSDFRDVQNAALEGNERAQLAIDIFYRRVIAYIGRYFIALGGVDAICFTAGIGENSFFARKGICDLLEDALGVELDEDANVNGKGDRLISTPNSKVKIFVIPTNEELVIARDTKRLLNL